MSTKSEILIKNILDQAKYFLDEAEEFYPFGAAIDNKNKLHPVAIYLENEHPESLLVFNKLEEAIKKRILQNEYIMAAIGLDVYISSEEKKDVKKPAIQINVYSSESHSTAYYIYSKLEDGYHFSLFDNAI